MGPKAGLDGIRSPDRPARSQFLYWLNYVKGFIKVRKCLWNIKSENYANKTACQNALQETVRKLDFQKLPVDYDI